MNKILVLGVVENETRAKEIVDRLREGEFSIDDISLLASPREAGRELALDENTEVPERAAAGAGIGGLVGTGIGWLVGVISLPVAGAGMLLAAGPVAAALGGAAAGVITGGLVGALSGAGLSEDEAGRYADELRAGNFLILVHANDQAEAARARALLEDYGARVSSRDLKHDPQHDGEVAETSHGIS